MTIRPRTRINRRRKIQSCQYCYVHKLKCDHATPCMTCRTLNVEDQCIYNFKTVSNRTKESSGGNTTHNYKVINTYRDELFKSRTFYPLFSSSLTDKLVFTSMYDSTELNPKFARNPITQLNKLHKMCPITHLNEIIPLFPSKLDVSLQHLSTFESSIHPIIPILSIKECELAIIKFYEQLKTSELDINNCLLLLCILFCASFSNLASGVTLHAEACTNYYRAFNFILKHADFPRYPNRRALETFVLVNFTLDPNMVEATNYSPMLIRIAQQLGLHKIDTHTENDSSTLHVLWHFLLYIDGSSSVVNGFPFSTRASILKEIPIPIKYVDPNPAVPIEFTIGRFYINKTFREVMDLTNNVNDLSKKVKVDSNSIKAVGKIIIKLCNSMENRLSEDNGDYFSSTLYVFLFRLHSRYALLASNELPSDKLLKSDFPHNEKFSNVFGDVSWILEKPQKFNKNVVGLSILILIQTLRRLTQENIQKYAWYSKGSTVMQYLFVSLKNLYQDNEFKMDLGTTFPEYSHVLPESVSLELSNKTTLFQIVLIDTLMDMLELKLAPLWNNFDLFQFTLIKNIKDTIWKTLTKPHIIDQEKMNSLKTNVELFRLADSLLVERNSICLDDCLQLWENDADFLQYSKSFAQWLSEL